MTVYTGLPIYDFAGIPVRPGDIIARIRFGSIIEHRALMGFDGTIAHSAGPGDYFRGGSVQEILSDSEYVRVVYPTGSLHETHERFARANQLVGIRWWDMNCIQTTDYVAGVS